MPLDDAEIDTLAHLARHLMRADGRVTDREVRAMIEIAREVGVRAFSDALERHADASPLDGPELLRLARSVHAPDARVDMFRFLAELANADGIDPEERKLLDALAATWDLDWTAE